MKLGWPDRCDNLPKGHPWRKYDYPLDADQHAALSLGSELLTAKQVVGLIKRGVNKASVAAWAQQRLGRGAIAEVTDALWNPHTGRIDGIEFTGAD